MSLLDGCQRCTALLSEVSLARLERDEARGHAMRHEEELHALRRENQALRQSRATGTDRIDLEPTEAGRRTSAITSKE